MHVVYLLILALLSVLQTASELFNENRLERLAEEGDTRASKVLNQLPDYQRASKRLRGGVVLVLVLCGVSAAKDFASRLVGLIPEGWGAVEPLAILAVVLIDSVLLFALGVLTPRRAALEGGEKLALRLSGAIRSVAGLFKPLFVLSSGISWCVLKLMGIDPQQSGRSVTEDEILAMVDQGEEKGAIESGEREMIENIFEFNNMTVEDCMTHRTDVHALRLTMEVGEIRSLIEETGRSRFPVCDKDIDDVIGVLTTRDFLLNLSQTEPAPWKTLVRDAYFVPESMRTDALFAEMRKRKTHMAIVVDEYGGTSGLITMEDLLEEIVGNIYDEYDAQDEQDIIALGEGKWRVEGSVELERLGEALDIELPDDDEFDTLGGLIFSQLTAVPDGGSHPEVSCFGLNIRVDQMFDRRVEWATVEKLATLEDS